MYDLRNKSSARGVRNNNPDNIRVSSTNWLGKIPLSSNTDKAFEQFEFVEYGIRAMYKNILTWIGRGKNTLKTLIHIWAPPHENNTDSYVKYVSSKSGIPIDKDLNNISKRELIMLGKVIAMQENGEAESRKIPADAYETAYNLIGVSVGGVKKK